MLVLCLVQIYGAFQLRIYSTSFFFYVMHNIFLTIDREVVNEKYDIKGAGPLTMWPTGPYLNVTVLAYVRLVGQPKCCRPKGESNGDLFQLQPEICI